jgi:hypothetical protein
VRNDDLKVNPKIDDVMTYVTHVLRNPYIIIVIRNFFEIASLMSLCHSKSLLTRFTDPVDKLDDAMSKIIRRC